MSRVFFCFVISIAFVLFLPYGNSGLMFDKADYYVFSTGGGSAAKMISAEQIRAAEVKRSIKKTDGESAYYLNTDNSAELLNKYRAKVVFCQTVDGIYNIYAYTDKFDGYLVLEGKRVNLHIAVTDNSTVIGSPIIFGGY